jgi:hypothetical protein
MTERFFRKFVRSKNIRNLFKGSVCGTNHNPLHFLFINTTLIMPDIKIIASTGLMTVK